MEWKQMHLNARTCTNLIESQQKTPRFSKMNVGGALPCRLIKYLFANVGYSVDSLLRNTALASIMGFKCYHLHHQSIQC